MGKKSKRTSRLARPGLSQGNLFCLFSCCKHLNRGYGCRLPSPTGWSQLEKKPGGSAGWADDNPTKWERGFEGWQRGRCEKRGPWPCSLAKRRQIQKKETNQGWVDRGRR